MELMEGERLVTEQREVSFRGELYTITHYSIEDAQGERWTTTELDTRNVFQVWDGYRERHAIPSVSDIVDLRKEYSLTQEEMSLSLGWSPHTWERYEEGVIPSDQHLCVLRRLITKRKGQ